MEATENCSNCDKEVTEYQLCSDCGAIVCEECFNDVYDQCPDCEHNVR